MQHDLNNRSNNGISVVLLWDDETSETFVEIETADEWHRFTVSAAEASDAFDHPFVYLARSVATETRTALSVAS